MAADYRARGAQGNAPGDKGVHDAPVTQSANIAAMTQLSIQATDGPVGAFAALQLAEAGLRVAILEKSREPVVLPRAVGLDGETLRAFQRLGLGDRVEAILQPPR